MQFSVKGSECLLDLKYTPRNESHSPHPTHKYTVSSFYLNVHTLENWRQRCLELVGLVRILNIKGVQKLSCHKSCNEEIECAWARETCTTKAVAAERGGREKSKSEQRIHWGSEHMSSRNHKKVDLVVCVV